MSEGPEISTVENHIYLYTEIDPETCLKLLNELRDLDRKLTMERLSRQLSEDFPLTPIYLHLQSGGGYVFSALAIIDTIQTTTHPVHAVLEGYVGSAAGLVAVSCNHRIMQPNAFFHMHPVQTDLLGSFDHKSIAEEKAIVDDLQKTVVRLYARHTGLKRKAIKKLLRGETWLTAKQCLEMGFVDEIK